jgi:hypothetical protein
MPGGRKPGYRHTEETKRKIAAGNQAHWRRVREAMALLAQQEAEKAEAEEASS